MVLFAPTLGAGITSGTIGSASLPFAPALAPVVVTPLWVTTTTLFPPGGAPIGEMFLTTIPSGSLVFPPFMVAFAPLAEIHDFVTTIVTHIIGTANVCREQEGTVILTRDVLLVVSVDREFNTSPSIVRRDFAVGVER